MSHIEGTIIVEGLIEGRVPPQPKAADRLKEWAEAGLGKAIRVNMQVDGGRFSAMPDNAPVRAAAMGEHPEDSIAESIEELLRLFPGSERAAVFSTLRSREYKPDKEVQTMYPVGPDGRVAVHQQSVAAKTEAAPTPLNAKQFAVRAVVGLAVAGAVLFVSSYWVDYRKLFRQASGAPQVDKIVISVEPIGMYVTLDGRALNDAGDGLVLTLKRTAGFPLNDAALDAEAARTATQPAAVRSRLMIDALARGYLRAEMFDGDGRYMGAPVLRIAGLRDHEKLLVPVALPTSSVGRVAVPARIEITY